MAYYQKFPRLVDPGLNPGFEIFQSWAKQLTLLSFTVLSVKYRGYFPYMAVLRVGTNGYTGSGAMPYYWVVNAFMLFQQLLLCTVVCR